MSATITTLCAPERAAPSVIPPLTGVTTVKEPDIYPYHCDTVEDTVFPGPYGATENIYIPGAASTLPGTTYVLSATGKESNPSSYSRDSFSEGFPTSSLPADSSTSNDAESASNATPSTSNPAESASNSLPSASNSAKSTSNAAPSASNSAPSTSDSGTLTSGQTAPSTNSAAALRTSTSTSTSSNPIATPSGTKPSSAALRVNPRMIMNPKLWAALLLLTHALR